ncbi:MAG: hypothetical protein ILNGONEN_00001 [Syntrophorhabdaceae bacterium]|nr:hypothetical protein [Syntrophorhabdaceae bacterium]
MGALFEKDLSPTRIFDELQFYLNTAIDRTRDLVIFDEIQQCPRALTALKYFCEQMPELAVCAAGSLLGVDLTDVSFPVGKVTFLDLAPMSFMEFLAGIEKTRLVELLETHEVFTPFPEIAHEQLWEMWKHYLIVGGLPEAVKTYRDKQANAYEAMQAVRTVQRDLLETYMADIAKHSGKTNALQIQRLWRNVTQQLARAQDGAAPKFRFKDAVPGIRSYEQLASPLDWLEKARLVLRTAIVEKAEMPLAGFASENRFKLYIFDVGLLGAMSDIKPAQILQYDYGSYKGYVAENYVAQELHASGISALYCWTGRTSEVEFLFETAAGILPIEVKSGLVTQLKSLKVFEERHRPRHSIILSAKNVERRGSRLYLPLYVSGKLTKQFVEPIEIKS